VGTSTGGPNALAQVFKTIPADFPVPVVIVQHMPPVFTAMLAERLTAGCPLKFHEGVEGQLLEAGHAYIAPGGRHMEIQRVGGRLQVHLTDAPPENSCRPAVDVLFRSVVGVCGGNLLGVIMTGMGQDGLRGCEYIRERGGQIVVQDEASSVVWGMPGYVAQAGLADKVTPLAQIALEIKNRTLASRRLVAA
jgi:two-component system chemotaxis response regulator CheB